MRAQLTPAPPLLLGIRHHGPGSARSVAEALAEYKPDCVLIEGPADADPLIGLADRADLEPPVAILAYREADPKVSAFWPLAAFSPEWVALRYAVEQGVTASFCDLPSIFTLSSGAADESAHDDDPAPDDPDDPEPSSPSAAAAADPIALLAHAAGQSDPESWWENVVELRRERGGEAHEVFAALAEAMAEVRKETPVSEQDLVREAHMRTVLRARIAEGFERIAVVCGAYHVPALGPAVLGTRGGPTADRALLARLPKPTKATAAALTWVPWTYTRLSYRSGYGAGIDSPGWYHHVFHAEDQVAQRWLVSVARLMREERYPVSSAHLIEAARLADALAQVRGRPTPGLLELTEAVRATLCEGRDEPLSLISRELIVGDVLGTVPADTPTVPLASDLDRQARRLRVPKSAAAKEYHLDLRNPNDLERSKLFHRLNLLGIDWAVPAGATSTGTFRESWQVVWEPLFEVALAEASCWGSTVLGASTAKAMAKAAESSTLGSLTVLVERCLTAGLPDAIGPLTELLQNRAALDHDLTDLATALPPLANILRYGDVRGAREDQGSARSLGAVVESIGVRLAVGLPGACSNIDESAAQVLGPLMAKVHAAIQILDRDSGPARNVRGPWFAALRRLADLETAHGLLVGRAVRLLADSGELDRAGLAGKMSRALARGTEPAAAAAWLDGFLSGAGQILVHDAALLGLIDAWLCALPPERFVAVAPLLRRTFGTFSAGERRAVSGRVLHLGRSGSGPGSNGPGDIADPDPVDADWAAATAPVVRLLLTGQTSERAR